MYEGYLNAGKFTLFISSNYSNFEYSEIQKSIEYPYYSIPNIMIVLIMFVMDTYAILHLHYAELGLLIFSLTLMWLILGLEKRIISITSPTERCHSRNNQTEEILNYYDSIKKLSRKLNQAVGPVVLTFVVEGIPYYSSHIGDIFVITDWYSRIRFILFAVQFFIILILAAEVSRRVSQLQLF